MKIAAFFSLVSLTNLAFAAPSTSDVRRQSGGVSEETIINSINTWRSDIEAVNDFLNMASEQGFLGEDDFRSLVGEAAGNQEFKDKVGDQLTQLSVLLPVVGVGNAEVLALLKELGGGEMVVQLQRIQIEASKPREGSGIADRLNELSVSHCKVLFNLDTYWKNVRGEAGITEDKLNIDVPRPRTREKIC
jgi:hypothetical protein